MGDSLQDGKACQGQLNLLGLFTSVTNDASVNDKFLLNQAWSINCGKGQEIILLNVLDAIYASFTANPLHLNQIKLIVWGSG